VEIYQISLAVFEVPPAEIDALVFPESAAAPQDVSLLVIPHAGWDDHAISVDIRPSPVVVLLVKETAANQLPYLVVVGLSDQRPSIRPEASLLVPPGSVLLLGVVSKLLLDPGQVTFVDN